ncbi:hypothetical protein EJK17_10840 [Lactobacillus xujianguonis]|uniref:Uncharacterized protein n=1 Tax=Lactobacillus xujianguonis TaxID=2495899 RepID=A0A437SSK5_9LACO|nr:hypothetical protein EJK17_10840 [Lactobacillus xujianguonis]
MSELEDIKRDLIFGHVMEKRENCRQLLKLIFPEKRFERIRVTPQKPINQLLKERKEGEI